MTIEELRKEIRGLVAAMEAKGFIHCYGDVHITSLPGYQLYLRYDGVECVKFLHGDDLSDLLDYGREWIASRPSVKDQKVRDALAASAKAIEALKEAEVEGADMAAFAAQLEDAMRTLSENILEHHSDA